MHEGEIVGVAGISGNGQMELMEILTGQRPCQSGEIRVKGTTYKASRNEAQHHNIRFLPEEPLHGIVRAAGRELAPLRWAFGGGRRWSA